MSQYANDNMIHLNEDQVLDAMMGDLAPEAAAHLAECDICIALVAEAEAPIAAFKAVSLAWSERRSATMPSHPAARTARWGQRLAWASAMSAALVMGITIPVIRHGSHGAPATAQTATYETASSGPVSSLTDEQQIDNDNQLLNSMHSALTVKSDTPSLLQPVGETAAPHAHRVQD